LTYYDIKPAKFNQFFDLFNVANSNAPDVYQQNYGAAYLNPLSITQARLFKISAQIDF
jgi:hypothetical protein